MDGDTQVQKSALDVGSIETNSKSPRDSHSAGDHPVHSSSSCLALMANDSNDFISCYPYIRQNIETSSTATDDDPSLSVDAEMPDFVQISPQSNNKNDLDESDETEDNYSDDEDSMGKISTNEKRRSDSSDGVILAQLQRSLSECHFTECEKGKNLGREQTKPQSRSAHSIPAVTTSPARTSAATLHSQSAPLVHQSTETDSSNGNEEEEDESNVPLGFLKSHPNKSPSFPAEFVPRVQLTTPTYNLSIEDESKKETKKQPFFRSNMKTRRPCPQEEEENDPDLPLMSTILENMPWNSNKARDYLQNYLNLALSKADDYKVQKLKQQLKYLTIRNKKRSYRNMSRSNENGESFPENNNRAIHEWGHKASVPLPRRPLPPPPLPPPPPPVPRLPKPAGLENWWRGSKVRNWEPFPGNMKRWEPSMSCLEPRITMAPAEPPCFRSLHPPRWAAPFWSNCGIPSQWPPIRHCSTPHYIRPGWCPPCPIRVAGGDILGARQDRKWMGPNVRKPKY